jgi:crossover junction endodeoxyribonuclease RuvC
MAELFSHLQPDELAVEQAFYGKSVPSAMRIGEARGVILAEARRHGVPVHQFAPARVKRVVTGNGAASKAAVAAMTCRLLGLAAVPAERDATDALAVALCRAEERRTIIPDPPSPGDSVRRCFFRGRKV